MNHERAKYQGQRSVSSKARAEKGRQKDTTDRITFPANKSVTMCTISLLVSHAVTKMSHITAKVIKIGSCIQIIASQK